MAGSSTTISYGLEAKGVLKGAVVLAGRFLFVLIFLWAGRNHFSKQPIAYVASQGVPLASVAVPLSGILALAGSVSCWATARESVRG